MTERTALPVEERILALLRHLEIEKAHFAAGDLGDLNGLLSQAPNLFASLTLVGSRPPQGDVAVALASRLLVFRGDTPDWDEVGRAVEALPGATLKSLSDWQPWSDLITRHKPEITAALFPFLAAHTSANMRGPSPSDSYGVVAGISYQIRGAGPPLVLFPLGLVPSQWDALLPDLAKSYCAITLGGAQLGMTSLLERRASLDSYLGMFRQLVQEADLQPGQSVLEIGCGTGALNRWLARYTNGANPITGVDISQFMLREAANLARMEGLDDVINFAEGDAENLDYPDNSFDLTMSITVLEEVDADKSLAEMIRVTRPGGRVGVVVRAMDAPFYINVPLRPDLKAKIEEPTLWGGRAGADGCDDVSLYRRFQQTELLDVKMFPYWVAFDQSWLDYVHGNLMNALDEVDAAEWNIAREQAKVEGTFIFNYPHHCAVGSVPV
jgi:SAM-dependent methyltransferase